VADHSGPLPDLEPSDLGPLAVESAAAGSSFLKGGDVLVQGGGGSGSSSILETMNPSQLSERIRELLRTKGPGRVEVKLRLDPPELGTVRLRLVATKDSVTVQLLARTHEAVEALDRRLPELAQALAQNGTHLSEAWVGLDNTGDGRRRSGAAEGDREKRLSGTSRGRRRDQDQADESDPVRPVVGPGARLDVIA
jgi:flagellar hook-length control protein FliK